ncbi:tRNA pseudouridine(38/39) synthase [Melitaea cinxia]|uniref:tRNA pseudouridine(38/39) synthase n=1 Tax=Melitaea cinxia TaxID=113334 RepID=UPI001E274718|nr:tRNA pseudouridine(38/39) synthase [Melitaea cinxia]
MTEKVPLKPKNKGLSREELINMDKNELVDIIKQLEAHNTQLKNIISKNLEDKNGKEAINKQKNYDFSKCHYRRILLRILYFGWDYQGLAVQEDSTKTIEHHLFHALTKSCLIEARENSNYHRCGRTDKGVSAFGQVISITVRSKHAPAEQSNADSMSTEIPYCKILNRLLPREIRAVSWMPIPDDKPEFSARFDCKKRKYKYYFPKSSLNIEAMKAACSELVGSHDFRNFCKMDVGNGVVEYTREILSATILPFDVNDVDNPTSMYVLIIEGNAFLWHQIRCIMGILLLVGQGRESPDIVQELLNIDKNPRKPQYGIALDTPLNLYECSYEVDNHWIYDENELKIIIKHIQNEWTVSNVKTTMMRDCLQSLEELYHNMKETKDGDNNKSERDSVTSHTDCLLQGVQSKVYKPLLKRQTCSSLEERIEYYTKKRKTETELENKK